MFQFTPVSNRIRKIRDKREVFTSGRNMTINSERTKIYTDYYKTHENEFPILKRAGALYSWCSTKKTNVFELMDILSVPDEDPQLPVAHDGGFYDNANWAE